ncbi:MAG: helicase-exonuclease AddAB subunit AddA [Lachnospiraceae bacterium]|jgi:ATP-dependent helicase/nuclease subunit A|nr:helicase-exonuclease AddAB subunit AddA [Lachnospiraceae bacterium]
MSVSWTEEQLKVIKDRGHNLLVSAAAGSGKTAVLTQRIVSMIIDEKTPLDINELLVVTFTKAAAAEMKDRIKLAIEEETRKKPNDERLRKQAALVSQAQISTIDSFCTNVIREHFAETDIDPGFRILEGAEKDLLIQDVLEEVLEKEFSKAEEDFMNFADSFGRKRKGGRLEDHILKLYQFSATYPDEEKWLSDAYKAYVVGSYDDLIRHPFIKAIKSDVREKLSDLLIMLRNCLSICSESDGPSKYADCINEDIGLIEDLLTIICDETISFDDILKKFNSCTFGKLPIIRIKDLTESEEGKKVVVKDLRDKVKKYLSKIADTYFYYNSSDEVLSDIELCRPFVEVLIKLTRTFSEAFAKRKIEKAVLDFSDMERFAFNILTTKDEDGNFVPTPAALSYKKRFKQIMIDEYQDINGLQESILTSIANEKEGEKSLFMVGDVKQSIYRFRLARPELFIKKSKEYKKEINGNLRIDLHKNFRSRAEVLDSVNFLFAGIMNENLGGIEYDDEAALYVGANYPENNSDDYASELLLIDPLVINETLAGDDDEDVSVTDFQEEGAAGEEVPVKVIEIEGRAIAGRIHELMKNTTVTDKKTNKKRSLCYSDIVVLARSMKSYAQVLYDIFEAEGIPAFIESKEGYFQTTEIGVLLEYLRFLNNAKQDIPLAAALTSIFGGISANDLALIKVTNPKLRFYEAVSLYKENGENEELKQRLTEFFDIAEGFRKKIPYLSVRELIWEIISVTGYRSYIAAMPKGEQREANLSLLLSKATDFDSSGYHGLFQFVRYIEAVEKLEVDNNWASIVDEGANAVRLMTIHKSKGLEFPVVIVAGLSKKFNFQDINSSLLLRMQSGIGMEAVDYVRRLKGKSLWQQLIANQERCDLIGEELRLLYVAFTRAKEKLIMTMCKKNIHKAYEKALLRQNLPDDKLLTIEKSASTSPVELILPMIARRDRPSSLKVRQINKEDIDIGISEAQTQKVRERIALEKFDKAIVYDKQFREKALEMLEYTYPYKDRQSRKVKFTVSELKKLSAMDENPGELMFEEPDVVPLLPKFKSENKVISGAAKGSIYHTFLEHLDFEREYTHKDLEEVVTQFVEKELLSEEDSLLLDRKGLEIFLNCPLGKRMQKAAKDRCLHREAPFVIGIPAKEIYKEDKEDDIVLIQGIIDAYIEDENEITVIDYKTDKVRTGSQLTDKYAAQLKYYARALTQMTHKKIKEMVIYSFTLGEEIRVETD